MASLEEICLQRILSIIVKNAGETEHEIKELESFRRHLRITNALINHGQLWKNVEQYRCPPSFRIWKLIENLDCTELHLPEILGLEFLKNSNSSKEPKLRKNTVQPLHEPGLRTLEYILDSKDNFMYLKKMSIGSVNRDENTKDSFLYETHIEDLQVILVNLFKKCSMLTDLEIETFCDGEFYFHNFLYNFENTFFKKITAFKVKKIQNCLLGSDDDKSKISSIDFCMFNYILNKYSNHLTNVF